MRLTSVLLFAVQGLLAQPDPLILLHHTFSGGTSGWTVLGQGGTVRATEGALEFAYEVKAKHFALAVLPAPPDTVRLKRLRFRAKTDHDTALAVLLSERKPGGGNYIAMFWSPAGTWQAIELTPADFSMSDGANDPVDADGRLDLDQVEGIGITDVAQFFVAQPENPETPIAIDRAGGAHTLQIADFEMLGGTPPAARPPLAIDRFDRGYLEWVTLGAVKLRLAPAGNPLNESALEASYEQTQGRYGVLLRRLAQLDLSKATGVAFDIASKVDTTVIVSLELKNGRRFNQTIYPPPNSEVFHVSLKFSDFSGDGKLDPSLLKSMALTDVTAAEGGGQPNTLWIGKVQGIAN
ncbi:MAG TPA: hypothetical protein VMS37_13195 [Verrucomicrobiae bacterium]|nr:hypothetical protein [Verrucomicrobiae bacterium]